MMSCGVLMSMFFFVTIRNLSLSALYEYSIRERWVKIRITNNAANDGQQYSSGNKVLSKILNHGPIRTVEFLIN